MLNYQRVDAVKNLWWDYALFSWDCHEIVMGLSLISVTFGKLICGYFMGFRGFIPHNKWISTNVPWAWGFRTYSPQSAWVNTLFSADVPSSSYMYVYIHMYIYIYIYTYLTIYMYILFICTCIHAHTHTETHTYTSHYIYIHIYTYMCGGRRKNICIDRKQSSHRCMRIMLNHTRRVCLDARGIFTWRQVKSPPRPFSPGFWIRPSYGALRGPRGPKHFQKQKWGLSM